jgi:hypothetical protein
VRTKREREREREREVVAARRRSGALLLSMMSLFGFENPKMRKLTFKRECPKRDNPFQQTDSNKVHMLCIALLLLSSKI